MYELGLRAKIQEESVVCICCCFTGEFVLSSSDPSICAVVYAVPSRAGRLSSSGLVVAGAPVDPTEVFTVEGIAPGVATLLLRDKRQPQNAVLLSVVVAPPVTIELRMQHLLLPVARGDIKTTIQAADRAQEATVRQQIHKKHPQAFWIKTLSFSASDYP